MRNLWLAPLLACALAACGTENAYRGADKADPKEEAAVALEQHRPDDAIEILQDALKDQPDDPRLLSLLSAAIAQKHGIDPIDMALKMGIRSADQADNAGQSNAITTLYGVVPDANDERIAGLSEAVALLNGISPGDRTKGDNFKLALLQTALITLRTKKFDANGDGVLSASELQAMNGNDAAAVLANLDAAAAAISQGADGENAQKVADTLAKVKATIASQPGANDEERLKNYLASRGM